MHTPAAIITTQATHDRMMANSCEVCSSRGGGGCIDGIGGGGGSGEGGGGEGGGGDGGGDGGGGDGGGEGAEKA